MSTEHIFVGMPSRIELDTTVDLSAATSQAIEARRPDGTTVEWAATVDGTKLVYAPIVSQWDQPGDWRYQGRFHLAGVTDPYYTPTVIECIRARFG